MNMAKTNNLSTIVLIVLIILCSGGAIAYGVNYLNKNNELNIKINQRQSELMEMKQKVAMLPLLREQSKTGIAELNKLRQFAPSREEQAAFVLELERMARQCRVDIISCKLDLKTKNYSSLPSYRIFQWAVELDGDYQGTKKFLEAIQESKRFMLVSNLDIISSEPESKKRKAYQLNAKLTLDLIAPSGQEKVNP